MENHRLTIGTLSAHCAAVVDAAAAQQLGAKLDRGVRGALPAALSKAVESVFDGVGGVIRLRSLRLELPFDGPFEADALARFLAYRIAAAIRGAFERAGADLRHWPSHAAYMASYVEMRLGIAPAPDWAFPDLRVFEHLPAQRAAAEIIRERPEVLAALARSGIAAGQGARVLASFDDASCGALLSALIERPAQAARQEALSAALRALAEVVSPADTSKILAAPNRQALALAMRVLAQDVPAIPVQSLIAACAATVGAVMAASKLRPAPLGHRARPRVGRASNSRSDIPEPLASAMEQVMQDLKARPLMERMAARLVPMPAASSRVQREDRVATRAQAARTEADPAVLSSPLAGLGLLLPSVVALRIDRQLSPTALAQAIWQTLEPEAAEAASRDPAIAALFPVDPREIDLAAAQPTVPANLAARLHADARPLFDTAPPARRWSALILAEFTSRLPGLRKSSRGYLQMQFLLRPGRVAITGKTATIDLRRLPLAIVLRMAGLSGGQMPVPHLGGRLLTLDLEEV